MRFSQRESEWFGKEDGGGSREGGTSYSLFRVKLILLRCHVKCKFDVDDERNFPSLRTKSKHHLHFHPVQLLRLCFGSDFKPAMEINLSHSVTTLEPGDFVSRLSTKIDPFRIHARHNITDVLWKKTKVKDWKTIKREGIRVKCFRSKGEEKLWEAPCFGVQRPCLLLHQHSQKLFFPFMIFRLIY